MSTPVGAAHLSASLMCARLAELGREVARLESAGVDSLHVDVMDGHFVPNLALSPDTVAALRPLTGLPIHVHLMVDAPEDYLEALASAGTDLAFFHVEATRHPAQLIRRLAELGITPGMAISPPTTLPDQPELLALAQVLLMAAPPGFAGQSWVPSTPERIRRLRPMLGPTATLHVDGNVHAGNAPVMWRSGADGFVCGSSALFTGPDADYPARIASLRAALAAADATAALGSKAAATGGCRP